LDTDQRRLGTLTLAQSRVLVANGVAAGGMSAKLDAAERALEGGAARVRIGDLAALTDATLGTHFLRS
jgi:acetylglutamate kinase